MQIAFIAKTADLARPLSNGAAGIDAQGLRSFAHAAEAHGFSGISIGGLVAGQDVAAVASFVLYSTTTLRVFLRHRIGAVPPTIAAQHLAMLDQLSAGRVAVAFAPDRGADGTSQEARLARVDEYLVLLKRLWANERPFDHEGTHYSIAGAFSAAKPFNGTDVPLSLGGLSGTAVKVAARHADVFGLPDATLQEMRRIIERVRTAAACHRRNPIRFAAPLAVAAGSAEGTALAILDRVEIGITNFHLSGLADPDALAWFGGNVASHVGRTLARHGEPDGEGAPFTGLAAEIAPRRWLG